jgi:hypothetical protein
MFENMGFATNGGAYRTTYHRHKLNFSVHIYSSKAF